MTLKFGTQDIGQVHVTRAMGHRTGLGHRTGPQDAGQDKATGHRTGAQGIGQGQAQPKGPGHLPPCLKGPGPLGRPKVPNTGGAQDFEIVAGPKVQNTGGAQKCKIMAGPKVQNTSGAWAPSVVRTALYLAMNI